MNVSNIDDHRKGGFLLLYRRIMLNPLFRDNPDARHLFMDLLLQAAWDDTVQDWRGKPVTVERGQVMISERRLAKLTGLTYQKVRTIINALLTHRIIKINAPSNAMPSIITICNYGKYQDQSKTSNASANAEPTQNHREANAQKKERINTHYAHARETVDPNSSEMARQSHLHMQLRAKCVKAANGKLNTKLVDALHDDFANVMDLIAEGITADTIVEAITERCQRLRPQQVSTWGYLVEAIRDFQHRKNNRFNPKRTTHDPEGEAFVRMVNAHYRGANP